MRNIKTYRNIDEYIQKKIDKIPFLSHIKVTKEFYLLSFFAFLFFIIFLRLFWLQIFNHSYYEDLLSRQHVSQSFLKAKRGNIFAYDKSGKPVQLTENITMYNIFVDPKFVWDKPRFIQLLTPVIYSHLCEMYGMKQITKENCIKNLEIYTKKEILPKEPEFFYYGSGIVTTGYREHDRTGHYDKIEQVLTGFTKQIAYGLIRDQLDKMIQPGIRTKNYLGFFTNQAFLQELESKNLDYISIESDNYVYIIPKKIASISREIGPLKSLLTKYGYISQYNNLENYFEEQENRYVKLASDANPMIAQSIKNLKIEYYRERNRDKIPLLHGLGLEPYTKRYYEYGSFLSNILGMVDKNGNSFYGIEQYFDTELRGKDGKIIGRSSSWVGNVGANDFQIENVVDGDDIYLTIDIGIQKEIESITKKYQEQFRADSVSILVFDPFEGTLKASANYPSFDPNDYNSTYQLRPLGWDDRYIIDDLTYLDVPVYINTGGNYRLATTIERADNTIPKYIAKNIYGPRVFVDKNIAMPYEPGSIFKAFTVGIGIDLDEINMYDFYQDTNKVEVGPYTIKNADPDNCGGYNSFLHAFVYSCNVGMVRIAYGDGSGNIFGIGKESFYNYLDKFGFGKLTNIELAGESEGFVENSSTVALSRYLNNSFGQGLLTTPLQVAAGYAPLINGGYYLKPTIIKGIFDKKNDTYIENQKQILNQILKPETSEILKEALFKVLNQNPELGPITYVEGYNLGGKSGTSQISYKGKYQQGIGWTNASFVGIITKDDPKYVVIIQIRRPRSSIWGGQTAGKVFGDIAKFLVNYSLMVK
ncbi:MAG: penicillin-binding protein 2 [Candidatus Absconditabacteria bacterium]|nr:penicillin-binding protein 2 [Candidatus Absconditabacteria bacterium]